MEREELTAYIAAQIEEIQKFKWIESERREQDIGFNAAALQWIEQFSADFRRQWNQRHSGNKTPCP